MPSLSKDLRDKLEKTVLAARVAAEAGASEALAAIGVDQGKAFEHLKPAEKALRNQLRARGRQAGDILDDRSGKQTIEHLVQVVSYEHWHRMLFARFLAENGLLLEPDAQVAVSLADVDELARDAKVDIWELAGRFAQRMLPAVFRSDDPVLALVLARENRTTLEKLVADLPREVFLADDSLGWTYQFWQTQRKDEVNKSEVKIGADELAPVTQLFTEDYMVDFLLHNTFGAWWAGKLGPINADTEEAARAQAELPAKDGLPAIVWTFLRFVKNEAAQSWAPAAGTFPDWPREAKKVTFLDPCMGSGHFVVFALPILARLRMEEENLDAAGAVSAVLRENIHGLELDERCTQIAAFNLALTAWKIGGYQVLPPLHLACSGLAPRASEAEWVALAGDNQKLEGGMRRLYRLFQKAAVLGSLINPRASEGDLLAAAFPELLPLLEKALSQESKDDTVHEMAVTAQGLAKAAEILAGQFVLVATNVPYLGRGKQDDVLKDYCTQVYPEAKADLATCFVERCLAFCSPNCDAALVTPQNWWFLASYSRLRRDVLTTTRFKFLVTLGEEAWQSFGDRGPVAVLMLLENHLPETDHRFAGINALPRPTIAEKIHEIERGKIRALDQVKQFRNPSHRISIEESGVGPRLDEFASYHNGVVTGDYPRFGRVFWEFGHQVSDWRFQQTSVDGITEFGGRSAMILWDGDNGQFLTFLRERLGENLGAWLRGLAAWGKRGILVSGMRTLATTLYEGVAFDNNSTVVIPRDESHLLPLWCYCSSPDYARNVRQLNQKVSVTDDSFVKVPFDLAHWQKIAAERYPHGLPTPLSSDPTQWLFCGEIKGSNQPLHVAVARLLGYRWPRQTGSVFPNCPALQPDRLQPHADADGIVCLSAVRGERAAADRIRTLLSVSLGEYDEQGLIAATASRSKSLEAWLRDDFFAQHCGLFHSRPFIWHIWDGRSDGFHALINYHKLAAPDGAGRKLLDLLTFAYLGDWIKKQRDEQKKPGAEDRLVAAEALQHELRAILAGEPPYDIFVRWKPLRQQPIGWEPDLNDGIRLNIRPFVKAKDVGRKETGILRSKPSIKWEKNKGTEPARSKADFPWFWGWDESACDFEGGPDFDGNRWNDCHYTNAAKRAARELNVEGDAAKK